VRSSARGDRCGVQAALRLSAPDAHEHSTPHVRRRSTWWCATLTHYSNLSHGRRTRGRRIALEIARGLHHLHHKRIIHFDLKSANVLLTRDGTAKIAVRARGLCLPL